MKYFRRLTALDNKNSTPCACDRNRTWLSFKNRDELAPKGVSSISTAVCLVHPDVEAKDGLID
jgi:hypothetical protein